MRIAADARRTAPRTAREAKMTKRERKLAARAARERFAKARKAQHEYERHLRKIARAVGDVVRAYAPRGWVGDKLAELTRALEKYAERLRPWAGAVARRMVAEVSRRDERAWFEYADQLGFATRAEIRSAPTGAAAARLMDEQVDLITSLPREAAKRVHKLSVEAITESRRASEIAEEIMRTGRVTRGRAELIARTETGRAATTFTEARAVHLGSPGYTWRDAHDGDVRHSHHEMNGKFVRWDSPPTLDGLTGHAGALPNCRCIPEPVLPE